MGRKAAFGASFIAGYMITRHGRQQAAASSAAATAADEEAWKDAYAQMEREAHAAQLAAADAMRDEVRHQAALTRRATWMSQDPVGQAWRDVTNFGGADERLAHKIEARNLSWRQAWSRQCDTDGLGLASRREVGLVRLIQPAMNLVLPLLGIAALLFVASAAGWLWNHSPFTPESQGVVLNDETGERTQVPRRGTREFLSPGLAVGAYIAAGVALLAYIAANVLDFRAVQAMRRADAEAIATNQARERLRVERYGFDPLAPRLPSEAHWAVLGDGTDPEAALALMAVEGPRQMRQPERMTMAHVNRLQAVAEWGGRVRLDTPAVLPQEMARELEQMRAR